ncbi:MAG TPA: penicillin-binding protein 2 [Rhodospirillales bacterium]|nr:penicillin-binding protein 2 [Rhodospirillales bacterium]
MTRNDPHTNTDLPSRLQDIPVDETVCLEGNNKQALETGRNRLLVTGVMFMIAFISIAVRLIDLTAFGPGGEPRIAHAIPSSAVAAGRADIVDRNGIILATSLPTASLYADPKDVMDPDEAADKLARVFPEINRNELLLKLKSRSRFVWISRNLTPKQQYAVNRLGIPGVSFQRGEQRVYPHGREAAHILGLTDVDGTGIAGVEKYFASTLNKSEEQLELSIDLRIQTMLRQELTASMIEFKAIGAAGVVLDVDTGEIISMVSLPDFDPNIPGSMRGTVGFNRSTKGVYEMGSTFKLFNTAMALDSGVVSIDDAYDASEPIRISRFTITDYHGKNRWLSVPEILVYSSNIGSAKMAMDVGSKAQKFYLDQLGLLHQSAVELPEIGQPQYPARWGDISTMTISYGHGVSVSPLQVADGVASLVNGGLRMPVTLLKHHGSTRPSGTRVLSEQTSKQMRALMRLVVTNGSGKQAAAKGYFVGGKTGTAEKQVNGRYAEKSLISSFVGAFPVDKPRFVILAMLDEPKGNKKTFNYATGGWVAAPVVSRMVSRIAALLGILPREGEIPGGVEMKTGKPRLASLEFSPAVAGGQNLATF